MSTTSVENIIITNSADSYESFLREITKVVKPGSKVNDLIKKLNNQRFQIDRWLSGITQEEYEDISFFSNICWFYRWLLSEGYIYTSGDSAIEIIREFIDFIKIPARVIDTIKWAVVFGTFACLDESDHEEIDARILEKYNPSNVPNTLSEVINSWMVHHILLRKRSWKKIDTFEEKLLLNYISLVEKNPELEDIFGVAIEIDMGIVYQGIKNEK